MSSDKKLSSLIRIILLPTPSCLLIIHLLTLRILTLDNILDRKIYNTKLTAIEQNNKRDSYEYIIFIRYILTNLHNSHY
ncbi:hypothetical protein EHRUM3_08620 [Ehrlichia ruminantium]|uniref:Uncharacterized protein n=1 Tax=Ehrlichia ruminantium TaxID=779 RepID=A0A170T6T1_EHRRU|nr:hypothetical protein EHRUM3_08620 [Ehrlichia ruminantium]